jgi:hypothetical protein
MLSITARRSAICSATDLLEGVVEVVMATREGWVGKKILVVLRWRLCSRLRGGGCGGRLWIPRWYD